MAHFDAIHSVDRPKLIHTLARLADELGRCPDLFIQVNTGEEPQKAGVMPDDLPFCDAGTRCGPAHCGPDAFPRRSGPSAALCLAQKSGR